MSKYNRLKPAQLQTILSNANAKQQQQPPTGQQNHHNQHHPRYDNDDEQRLHDYVNGINPHLGNGFVGGGRGGGNGWGEGGWNEGSQFSRKDVSRYNNNTTSTSTSSRQASRPSARRKPNLPVILHIECRDLLDMDLTSKSDPFVVLSIATLSPQGTVGWQEIDRTETVWDCLDPVFVKSFATSKWNQFTGIKNDDLLNVLIKFDVYDNDNKKVEDLSYHDFIGACKCKVGRILGGGNMNVEMKLENGKKKNPGFLTVMGEYVKSGIREKGKDREREREREMEISFYFSLGRDVSSGLKKAFITISRSLKGGKWTPVWRTETIVIHKGLMRREGNQREFKCIVMNLVELCAGFENKQLRIELWKFKKSGAHERVGIAHTTYEQLKSLRTPFVFNMKSFRPSDVVVDNKGSDEFMNTPSTSSASSMNHGISKRWTGIRSSAKQTSDYGSRASAGLIKGSSSADNDNDQVLVLQDRTSSKRNAAVSFTFRLLNF